MNERLETLLKEYEVATARLNGHDAWAHHFVASFFVFTAAIITGIGFTLNAINTLNAAPFSIFGIQTATGDFIVSSLSLLGIVLTAWACAMLLDFKLHTNRILARLAEIEVELYGLEDSAHCFARAHLTYKSGFLYRLGVLTVPAVMIAFSALWVMFFVGRTC